MKMSKFSVTSLVCAVLACLTAIVYAFSVSRDHSPVIIACMAAAAVCSLILWKKKIPFAEYVPFLLVLVSIAVFTRLGFDEIGDILSKNNMNGLSMTWVASAVLLVLTGIANAVCTVMAGRRE